MANVWLAELSYDGVSVVGETPAGFPANTATLASRVFLVADDTGATGFPFAVDHAFCIEAQLNTNFTGGGGSYEWEAQFRVKQKPIPPPGEPFDDWVDIFNPIGGAPTFLVDAGGNNGAAFFNAGLVSVTKDLNTSSYYFATPLGTMTVPFGWLNSQPFTSPSWVPDNGPIQGIGFGHALAYSVDTITNSETTKWFNFFTKLNGVTVAGNALSAADPGSWYPPFEGDWIRPTTIIGGGYLGGGGFIPANSGQETTRYRSELVTTPLVDNGATWEQRLIMTGMAGFFDLDMTEQVEHNFTRGVWNPAVPATSLVVRRTDSDGSSWTDFTAVSGTNVLDLVTIQVFSGMVILLYHDETALTIKQSLSRDQGLTWSTRVPGSISGSSPRLVASPEGTFFYFSLFAGDIVLQRSFDFGGTLFDGSPIVVATSVPMQAFGAVLTADKALLVAYADGMGAWITRISRDLGLTWATT